MSNPPQSAARPSPLVGGIYEHQKGPLYLVLGVATDSNNHDAHEEPQVVYISIESTDRSGWPFHIRSLSEFNERFWLIKETPTNDATGNA